MTVVLTQSIQVRDVLDLVSQSPPIVAFRVPLWLLRHGWLVVWHVPPLPFEFLASLVVP